MHRRDVFAEQQSHGAYYPVRQVLTNDDIAEHLGGMASYGVYVIDPDASNTIKYLMFDLDTHAEDAQHHLRTCVQSFVAEVQSNPYPYGCLLYETSGNKGTHVWLFFDEPVSAAKARRWVEAKFMPAWRGKAQPNRWPLEVFPKQDSVPSDGYGNLVKLPLGKHAVSGKFSEFVPAPGWATGIEDVEKFPAALVPDCEPESGTARHRTSNRTPGDGPTTPFPCVDRILREGVGRGYRDNAMFHLALYFFGHGLDEDLAVEMCMRANEEFEPPMPEDEVRHKVASAYRGRYQSARCGTEWLVDICPGPCRGGWSVRQTDAGTLKRAQVGELVECEVVRCTREEGRSRVTVKHPDASNQPTFLVGQ